MTRLIAALSCLLSTVAVHAQPQLRGLKAIDKESSGVHKNVTVHCDFCEQINANDVAGSHGSSKSSSHQVICDTTTQDEADGYGDMEYDLRGFPQDVYDDLLKKATSADGCIPARLTGVIKKRTDDITKDTITWMEGTSKIDFTVASSRKLREVQLTGTARVLVVQINSKDSQHEPNLGETVFGDSDYNLKNVYKACSRGQLEIQPATDSAGKIHNGVFTVDLDVDLGDSDISANDYALENTATQMAEDALGIASLSDEYSHVMFCYPPGVTKGGNDWFAFANMPGWRSVYSASACRDGRIQVHEVGHK